jgi:hypothetical protein
MDGIPGQFLPRRLQSTRQESSDFRPRKHGRRFLHGASECARIKPRVVGGLGLQLFFFVGSADLFPALQALRGLIAFAVTAPLSPVCVVVAKLLVIQRFANFLDPKMQLVAKLLVIQRFANFLDPKMQLTKPRSVLFGRDVVGLVVVGCIVGFSCNLAASVHLAKSSALYDAAAQNAIAPSYNRKILSATAALSEGVDFSAGFFGLEAFMLLLIVVILFTVSALGARSIRSALIAIQIHVPASTRMLTSKEHSPDAATSKHVSRRLQRQVVGTVGVVLVSFLLRSAYSIMFAVANGFHDSDVSCQDYVGRCSNCYNTFTHVQIWMLNTPSFQLTIMLMSQPVALVVALWGMTSGHTLEVMRSQCAQSDEISL